MKFALGSSAPWTLLVASLCLATCSMAAPSGHAMSKFKDWMPARPNNRTFPIHFLEKIFDEAVKKSREREASMLVIEAAMETSFRSLPKKGDGLLSHSAASYLVQRYFTQVHHYNIKGPGTTAVGKPEDILAKFTSGHEASILQAPEFVESILETRQAGRGLTLSDAAVMASTLKSLIEDEVLMALDQAMEACETRSLIPIMDELDISNLELVFQAWEYMLYYDSMDQFEEKIANPTHRMVEFGRIAKDIAATKAYQQRNQLNPFERHGLATEHRMALALDIIDDMGSWQDTECKDMKAYLTSLDPYGTGRVPLDIIYEQPPMFDERGKITYRFAESQDKLRELGALDESVVEQPQVLISNYILGPANCLKLQSFHTYCCLSECDGLMAEIEGAVQGPAAAPELLLDLLANITTTSMEEPRPISDVLLAKLSGIAAYHGGVVPLHGRLFAQWLHFAFPQECPYPHVTQRDAAGNLLTTSFFQQVKPVGPDVNRIPGNESEPMRDAHSSLLQWTDDEMLPFFEEEPNRLGGGLRLFVRIIFMGGALIAMFLQLYSSAMQTYRNYYKYGVEKRAQGLSIWETSMDKVA